MNFFGKKFGTVENVSVVKVEGGDKIHTSYIHNHERGGFNDDVAGINMQFVSITDEVCVEPK